MKIKYQILVCLLIVSVLSCQSNNIYTEEALENFSDSNMIGIWQAQYDFYDGTEILVFNKDKTYSQSYEDTKGFLYSNTGGWKVETDLDGRVFVHLSNGLWFPFGPEIALLKGMDIQFKGEQHKFFDHQTSTLVQMPNKLVLEIVPRNNIKGFVLFHFAYDIDSAPEYFEPIKR